MRPRSTSKGEGEGLMKKAYEKPAIIHTEKIEARAVSCSKSDDACAQRGPITS